MSKDEINNAIDSLWNSRELEESAYPEKKKRPKRPKEGDSPEDSEDSEIATTEIVENESPITINLFDSTVTKLESMKRPLLLREIRENWSPHLDLGDRSDAEIYFWLGAETALRIERSKSDTEQKSIEVN